MFHVFFRSIRTFTPSSWSVFLAHRYVLLSVLSMDLPGCSSNHPPAALPFITCFAVSRHPPVLSQYGVDCKSQSGLLIKTGSSLDPSDRTTGSGFSVLAAHLILHPRTIPQRGAYSSFLYFQKSEKNLKS